MGAIALKDALLVEYDHEMATTRKLLLRIPEDKLAWRPHEKSMTLGHLARHLANLPNWGPLILCQLTVDLADVPRYREEPSSRGEIIDAFEQAQAAARKALDQTNAEFGAVWSLRRGDRQLLSIPRLSAFRAFVLNHVIHHRGQLSVYLRLNEVPVPAIYGPSADEG